MLLHVVFLLQMRMRATVGVAAATPLLFGASVYAAETETKSSRKVKITQVIIIKVCEIIEQIFHDCNSTL